MSCPLFDLGRALRPSRRASIVRELNGGRRFRLAYARTRGGRGTPVLVIPGGPGISSFAPYSLLRRLGARRRMDLLMVEHRGVGRSRRDDSGSDLLVSDVSLEAAADDLEAVLAAEDVGRVVVYGTSYGSYLAQLLALRHPSRIAALVLDSPLLDPRDDLTAMRRTLRERLWARGGAESAAVRALSAVVPEDELVHLVSLIHDYAGPEALARFARAWAGGRLVWLRRLLSDLGGGEYDGRRTRSIQDADLVRGIAFGELGFGLERDGGPLDPQAYALARAGSAPAFAGAPADLREELRRFTFPTVVLSGERDLRTPRGIADRIARLAPRGLLVDVPGVGHSILDAHPLLALAVSEAAGRGRQDLLPFAARRLASLPRLGASALLGRALNVASALAERLSD